MLSPLAFVRVVKSLAALLTIHLVLAGDAHAQERGVRWWQPALVVGAIAAATLADRGLNDWFRDQRTAGSDGVARVFRNGGEPEFAFGIPASILAAGVISGRPELRRRGGRVLLSVVTAGLTTGALKRLSGRLRPAETNDPFLFKPFSDHDAFPSGHTTMAFALATSLSEEIGDRWAGAALYAFATGTAWSRMNDRRHWFSDVLAGATVGFTAAKIVERHPPRFLVGPAGARLEWRIEF